MQNMHAHAMDQQLHLQPETVREADLSRGYPSARLEGRARVIAYDVPVRCGEVLVNPGELVFADFDGIVVIPAAVEQEVLTLAKEKAGKESLSRQELLAGKSLKAVYRKYGVL
jgi:regulator of RNase E activity RraA